MSSTGNIKLIDANDNIVRNRNYNSRIQRNSVIDKWRKCYGEKFCQLLFIISPHIKNDEYVGLDGMNYNCKR